ncbi:zinc finger protein squeeze-like [Vespa crabro]|uniref:zinc finger protein squeeze-like n=1 Tax=Vespa crabro TaxID=7445 RepID=UPI001F00F285|nr:zinc finger protein squeeze-like [Vespa crabro]
MANTEITSAGINVERNKRQHKEHQKQQQQQQQQQNGSTRVFLRGSTSSAFYNTTNTKVILEEFLNLYPIREKKKKRMRWKNCSCRNSNSSNSSSNSSSGDGVSGGGGGGGGDGDGGVGSSKPKYTTSCIIKDRKGLLKRTPPVL